MTRPGAAMSASSRWWTLEVTDQIAVLTFARPPANWMSLAAMPQPTVAAIDGQAWGGGCEATVAIRRLVSGLERATRARSASDRLDAALAGA